MSRVRRSYGCTSVSCMFKPRQCRLIGPIVIGQRVNRLSFNYPFKLPGPLDASMHAMTLVYDKARLLS